MLPVCSGPSPEDQVSLTEVVTPDVLRPLASSPEVQDQLSPHLPPTTETPQVILTSPQFQQALGVFGSALQSGQLGPLMTQFGLGEQVAQAATTGSKWSSQLFLSLSVSRMIL